MSSAPSTASQTACPCARPRPRPRRGSRGPPRPNDQASSALTERRPRRRRRRRRSGATGSAARADRARRSSTPHGVVRAPRPRRRLSSGIPPEHRKSPGGSCARSLDSSASSNAALDVLAWRGRARRGWAGSARKRSSSSPTTPSAAEVVRAACRRTGRSRRCARRGLEASRPNRPGRDARAPPEIGGRTSCRRARFRACEREAPIVVARRCRRAGAHVVLLGLLSRTDGARDCGAGAAGAAARWRRARAAGEEDERDELVVVDRAGSGDDEVRGT